MDFGGLDEFLLKKMKMASGYNYQPLVIKILNENDGKASKEKLQQELHDENPDFPPEHFDEYPFDVLIRNSIIEHEKSDDTIRLTSFGTYKDQPNAIESISELCDEKILEANTFSEIERLSEKGVSDRVRKALLWYWKRRGRTYTRDSLRKPNKDGVIDDDMLLENEQRLHGMVKGVFKAKGEEFPQAITLNPDSKWEMELKTEHPTIRVDYDFKDETSTRTDQIEWIEKAREKELPLGVAFCVGKNRWRILGLCKVTEKIGDTLYRFEHWGISEKESKKLKDDAIRDYDHHHSLPELRKFETINWQELEDMDAEQKIVHKNMSSDKKNIYNILYEVDEGNWMLPGFQRFFDWKPKDVSGLLESILRGYYVGSFLLWNVEDSKKNECETFPIEGSVPKKDEYKMIVLDGQQRITSLNYAIRAPERSDNTRKHPGFFYIDVRGFLQNDEEEVIVNTKKKIDDKDTFDRLLFPLYFLEKPDDWINGLREFLKSQNNYSEKFETQIFNPIRDQANRMKDFDIPIIELKRIPFDVVSIIFEKVNTKGKRLKVFDLMNNRMAGYGIRLRNLWTDTENKYPLIKKYDEKMTTKISRYIMESISLSYSTSMSCKKADLLEMYSDMEEEKQWTPDKFNKMWEDISKFTNTTLSTLEDKQKGFGVPSPDFIPYEPMIPVMTSLIQQIKEEFKDKEASCYDKLKRWYWTSVFGVRYSQGVEGRKKSDFVAMKKWFDKDENVPKFILDFQKNYQRIEFEDVTSLKSAIYRGILCMIMKKGAIDTRIRFSEDNKEHIDHIFPKTKITKAVKNSILNMTWLTDTTNISKSNKMPKEYYAGIRKKHYGDDKEKLMQVLSSHMINDDSYELLMTNKFDDFLESRKKEFLKAIADEIEVEFIDEDESGVPTQTSRDTPYGNKLVLRNAIESCKKEITLVSRYLGTADIKTIYVIREQLDAKKIRLLTSKIRADDNLKSDFKSFRKEMADNHGIECEMRIMSKDVESEQHARYLFDPDKCFNSIDADTAHRGQSDDVTPCKRPKNLEKWWDDSLEIFSNWKKIQDMREK